MGDKKQIMLVLAVLFGILVAMSWVGQRMYPPPVIEKVLAKDSGWPSQEQEEARIKRDRARRARLVTAFEFESLRTGMTYAKVVQIIGDEGEERSSTYMGGYNAIVYSWQNPNGSNMIATFQNGRLISKAQSGLH